MRVRIDHYRYTCFRAKLEEFASRIHFVYRFPQSSGVDLKCDTVLMQRRNGWFIVAAQVSRRTVTKLLRQVWVRNKIDQFGFDAFDVIIPVKIPNFFNRLAFETGNMLRIIYIPTGTDVVDAADEVVPLFLLREFF